ncbi:hypothetical protein [Novacetimonas maltaceti]|uniref:hypothetical protein n=1 Tax=Novacetimonas maltaceti TaxID=1203393 RepID=UPI0015E173F2|nr:hypothetical protein [Novacetimonas maltaceti]
MTKSVAAGVPFGEAGFTEIDPHCQRLMQTPQKHRKTAKPEPKTPIPATSTRKKKQKKEEEAHASPSLHAQTPDTSVRVNSMPVNRQVVASLQFGT